MRVSLKALIAMGLGSTSLTPITQPLSPSTTAPTATAGSQWKGYQSSSSLGNDTSGTAPLDDAPGTYYANGVLQTNPSGSATALIPSHVVQWTGKPIIGLDRCQYYPIQSGVTELVVTCIHGDPIFGGMKSVKVRVAGGAWVELVQNGQQIGALYGTPGYRFKAASLPGQTGGLVRIDVDATPVNGKRKTFSRVMLLDDQGTLASQYASQVYYADAATGVDTLSRDGKSWATAWKSLEFSQASVPTTGLVTINARGVFLEDGQSLTKDSTSGWAMNDLPMVIQGPSATDLSQFVMGRSSAKRKDSAFCPKANKVVFRNVTYDGEFASGIAHNSKTGVLIFQNWRGIDASGPNGYVYDARNNASDPSGFDVNGRQTGGFGYYTSGYESQVVAGLFQGYAYKAFLDCRDLVTHSCQTPDYLHNAPNIVTAFDALAVGCNTARGNVFDPNGNGRYIQSDYDNLFVAKTFLHMPCNTPGKGRFHDHLTLRIKSVVQVSAPAATIKFNGSNLTTPTGAWLLTFDTAKDGTTPTLASLSQTSIGDFTCRFMKNNDAGFAGNKMLDPAVNKYPGSGWGANVFSTRKGDAIATTDGTPIATLTDLQCAVYGDLSQVVAGDVVTLFNANHSDVLQTQYNGGSLGGFFPFPDNMSFLGYQASGPGMGNMFILQSGQSQQSPCYFTIGFDSGGYFLDFRFNPGLGIGDALTVVGQYPNIPRIAGTDAFNTINQGLQVSIKSIQAGVTRNRRLYVNENLSALYSNIKYDQYKFTFKKANGDGTVIDPAAGISIDVNGNWQTVNIQTGARVDCNLKLNDCIRIGIDMPHAGQYTFIDSVNADGSSGLCSRPIYDPTSGQADATGVAIGPSTPVAITAETFYWSTSGANLGIVNFAENAAYAATPVKATLQDDGHRNLVVAQSTINRSFYWQPYANRLSAEGREDFAWIENISEKIEMYSGGADPTEPSFYPQRTHLVNSVLQRPGGFNAASTSNPSGTKVNEFNKYVRDDLIPGSGGRAVRTGIVDPGIAFAIGPTGAADGINTNVQTGQVVGATRTSLGSVVPFDRNGNPRVPGVSLVGADVAAL